MVITDKIAVPTTQGRRGNNGLGSKTSEELTKMIKFCQDALVQNANNDQAITAIQTRLQKIERELESREQGLEFKTTDKLERIIEAGQDALIQNASNDVVIETIQKRLIKVQAEIDSRIEAQEVDTDPFSSALKMAIENDGSVDTKELNFLNNLVKKRPDQQPNFPVIGFIQFTFPAPHGYYGAPIFHFDYFGGLEESEPGYEVNENLRAAYQIAALDGEINNKEMTQLKELMK